MKKLKLLALALTLTMIVPMFAMFAAAEDPAPAAKTFTIDGKADEWATATNLSTAEGVRYYLDNDLDYLYGYIEAPLAKDGEEVWKTYLLINFYPGLYPSGKTDTTAGNPYIEARIRRDGVKADNWPNTSKVAWGDDDEIGFNKWTIKTAEEGGSWKLEFKCPIPAIVRDQLLWVKEFQYRTGLLIRYNTDYNADGKGGNKDLIATPKTDGSFDWNNGIVFCNLTNPKPLVEYKAFQTVEVDGNGDEWNKAPNLSATEGYVLATANDLDYLYVYMKTPYTVDSQNLWKTYLLINFDPAVAVKGKQVTEAPAPNTVYPYVEARIAADGTKADVWPNWKDSAGQTNWEDGAGLGYTAENIVTVIDETANTWTFEAKFPIPDAVKANLAHADKLDIKIGALSRFSTSKSSSGQKDVTVSAGTFDWNNGAVTTTIVNPSPFTPVSYQTITLDGDASEWTDPLNLCDNSAGTSYKYYIANDLEYMYVYVEVPYTYDSKPLAKTYLMLNLDFDNCPKGKAASPTGEYPYVEARISPKGTKADVWPNYSGTNWSDGLGLGFVATNIATVTDEANNVWKMEARFPLPNSVKTAVEHNMYHNVKVGMLNRYTDGSNSDIKPLGALDWNNGSASLALYNPNPVKDPITAKVRWIVNADISEETYQEGETPEYKGNLDPFVKGDYTYYFNGWDPEILPAAYDVTYTAQWRREKIEKEPEPTGEGDNEKEEKKDPDPSGEGEGEDKPAEEKKGCSSALVGTSALVICAVICAVTCAVRRRKED